MKDLMRRLRFECKNCGAVASRKTVFWRNGKRFIFLTMGNCSGEKVIKDRVCDKCCEGRVCLRCGEPVRAAMLCMSCAIEWAEIYPKYENYMYAYSSMAFEEDGDFPLGCLVVFDGRVEV